MDGWMSETMWHRPLNHSFIEAFIIILHERVSTRKTINTEKGVTRQKKDAKRKGIQEK